jgi:hypothetical protein
LADTGLTYRRKAAKVALDGSALLVSFLGHAAENFEDDAEVALGVEKVDFDPAEATAQDGFVAA